MGCNIIYIYIYNPEDKPRGEGHISGVLGGEKESQEFGEMRKIWTRNYELRKRVICMYKMHVKVERGCASG
jgi:hypothetical protein